MNIRLYHSNSIVENSTSLLTKEQTHYVVNVMRLKRGSKLNFFNKNGEWESEVIFLDKERVEVKFLKKIKQPFCDGSHKGTEFTPFKYLAEQSKKVFFCSCKQTNDQPLCDGSHNIK